MVLAAVVALLATNYMPSSHAFVVTTAPSPRMTTTTTTLNIFNKKKKEEEDLSYIETRDMTRAEMEELNKQNEDIMNAELIGMTLFSLIISIPISPAVSENNPTHTR